MLVTGRGGGAPERSRVQLSLSPAEVERIRGDVVQWGLQEAQLGRRPSESELRREYDRRLRRAQAVLEGIEAELQDEYDRRLREAEVAPPPRSVVPMGSLSRLRRQHW